MDPVSIAAISAAVGGSAGKLVEKAWGVGEKWLDSYFKDHQPAAQEAARENALDFLNELAGRVHQLEEAARNDQQVTAHIESALADPDFSALLKESLIGSSRTQDHDKHRLLARIVSERLRSEPEQMVALCSSLACHAVQHLTPKQIEFLGIATFALLIRPNPFPPPLPPHDFGRWYEQWLTAHISPYLPLSPVSNVDLAHLESASCIRWESFISRDLKKSLSPPEDSGYDWAFDDFVENTDAGKGLLELWEKQIKRTTLTTAGQLIGIYVHDDKTGTTTAITW